MDPEKVSQFKHRMNTLAYGEAMLAAARDYGQELIEQERAANEQARYGPVDVADIIDDDDDTGLAEVKERRLEQLKQERQQEAGMQNRGHGQLTDIVEGEFLEVVTGTRAVVCHFHHAEFERCRIMDSHLRTLAARYFKTRFCRISAPDAPFFVAKLKVQTLPCVVMFLDGVAVDRLVGFGSLGGADDFKTGTLEQALHSCGVIVPVAQGAAKEAEQVRHSVRKGGKPAHVPDEDEDSDFD